MKVVPLLLIAFVLASCGDGDAEPTASPPSTAAPVTTTATTGTDSGVTTAPATVTTPPTTVPDTTLAPLSGLRYTEVASVSFPTVVTARAGDALALVAERGGVIRTLGPEGIGEVVVDLRSRTTVDGERGLLGLARHPVADDRLFVHYTDLRGNTVVSEMTMEGWTADPGSERMLLTVTQPASNHNGGMIQFGPDGALYLGLGDGGGAGDRFGNGQDRSTLLGGLVRIDVDSGEATLWHYGLRNPWRFWIDGDEIWIGDVGQGAYEEIDLADVAVPDVNYGWPITEAAHCFEAEDCDTEGQTLPLLEIERGDGGSCAVTGGIVYRGSRIPELDGRFLFSDYCGGYLRSVDRAGDVTDHTGDVGFAGQVVSFGVDGAGEAYVLTTDRVLRIDPVR
jgi:glucose/arabinose dehydrogenase